MTDCNFIDIKNKFKATLVDDYYNTKVYCVEPNFLYKDVFVAFPYSRIKFDNDFSITFNFISVNKENTTFYKESTIVGVMNKRLESFICIVDEDDIIIKVTNFVFK